MIALFILKYRIVQLNNRQKKALYSQKKTVLYSVKLIIMLQQ